jgi:hypothetical protein
MSFPYCQVAKLSIQTGVISEYTCMSLLETDRGNQAAESPGGHKVCANLVLLQAC